MSSTLVSVRRRADPAAAQRGQDGPTPRQAARPRHPLRPRRSHRHGSGCWTRWSTLCAGDPARGGRRPGGTQDPARARRRSTPRCAPRRPRGPTRSTPACCTTRSGSARCRPPPGAGRPSRVRVTSSLFGLVAPTDRIPAYRLSGDAVLPGLGTVAGVWREALGPVITELVGDGLLVDLRSGMYAAFWRPGGLRRGRHRPGAARGGRPAPGGQPLQQGHQGPDRPRAARGRRQPAHAGPAGRGAARPGLDRRGGDPMPRARCSSTWWSGSCTYRIDDPHHARGRLAVLPRPSDEQPPLRSPRPPESQR